MPLDLFFNPISIFNVPVAVTDVARVVLVWGSSPCFCQHGARDHVPNVAHVSEAYIKATASRGESVSEGDSVMPKICWMQESLKFPLATRQPGINVLHH